MKKEIQEINESIIDSAIQILSDSVLVSGRVELSDTLKIIDVGNYVEHPAFLLSIITISIALFAIFKPMIDQRNMRRKLREYTLFFAQQMIDTFDKKIVQVKDTAQKIEDIDATVYVYTVSLTYRASNLLSIPQNELFQIFVSKKENPDHTKDFKHFKNLFDAIAFFITHDGQAEKNYGNFLSAAKRHENKFSNNIDKLIRHYDRLRSNADLTNTKPSEDPFLKEFDEILSDWKELDNYINHSVVKSKLLNPLKKVAKKYIKDMRALILLEIIVEAKNADFQLRDAKKVYSKVFNELAETLEKNRNSLSSAIDYFNQ